MRAVGPLKDAAQENLDPDLRRAALQALRTLGVRDADEIFAEAIMDPAPSVRIAAAEGVSEFRIEAAIPQLRASLDRFPDEASSEVAYSLGTVGSDSDVERILAVAQRCVSVITRRRCLLGVARLWGVEREVYRLFQLEGLSRDAALYELLRAAQRDNLDLAAALNLYSQGDEHAALRKLGVTILVEDLFIVAACAVGFRVGYDDSQEHSDFGDTCEFHGVLPAQFETRVIAGAARSPGGAVTRKRFPSGEMS